MSTYFSLIFASIKYLLIAFTTFSWIFSMNDDWRHPSKSHISVSIRSFGGNRSTGDGEMTRKKEKKREPWLSVDLIIHNSAWKETKKRKRKLVFVVVPLWLSVDKYVIKQLYQRRQATKLNQLIENGFENLSGRSYQFQKILSEWYFAIDSSPKQTKVMSSLSR